MQERRSKPKITFPKKWTLTERKFVIKCINDKIEVAKQIERMASRFPEKYPNLIRPDAVNKFFKNNSHGLNVRKSIKEGMDRQRLAHQGKAIGPNQRVGSWQMGNKK